MKTLKLDYPYSLDHRKDIDGYPSLLPTLNAPPEPPPPFP